MGNIRGNYMPDKTISEAVKKFVIEKLSYNQGHDGWNDGEYNVDREVENINDFAKQQFKAAEAQAQALGKAYNKGFYAGIEKERKEHQNTIKTYEKLLKQIK